MSITPNKILIFRLASIGDTVVALPAFRLIAKAFPGSERWVLTNSPFGIGEKEVHMSSVLSGLDLVHGYLATPMSLRLLGISRSYLPFLQLIWKIRRLKPEILINLLPIRNTSQILRHKLFFRLCGIKTFIGLPYDSKDRTHLWLPDKQLFESESSRLVRNLAILGQVDLEDPDNWDLKLSNQEKAAANKVLQGWLGRSQFLVCNVGTKVNLKEWGEDRWLEWIQLMTTAFPKLGLALIGSPDEFERCERMAALWRGPTINLCGQLTPRESAAVLAEADIFVGHDSGPMHLSAAVGTPCVAIFSAREKPGVWFPYGKKHKVIYHKTECFDCQLEVCVQYQQKCIRSISVDEVFEAASALLTREEHSTLFSLI
ncbi:MAG: glycosyltransferase family 9 protein [Candidatus Competibacteraceae bacterium]